MINSLFKTAVIAFLLVLIWRHYSKDPVIDPPSSPPPAATPATTPSLEKNYLTYAPHLAILEGDKSKGSGFVALFQGKAFLFTNTHVLSGNIKVDAKLMDGAKLDTRDLLMAHNYDVSIFPQQFLKDGLSIHEKIGSEVAIGDSVTVLGNSLGSGVATEIRGSITGIGPKMIEVDAQFVLGNSGSPVIHVKSGKVIGIATYVTVSSTEGIGSSARFNRVERRFAYRLDNVPGWSRLDWQKFRQESGVLNALQERNNDISNFAEDIVRNGSVTRWSVHTRRGNYMAPLVSNWQKELSRTGRNQRVSNQLTIEKKRLIAGVLAGLRSDLAFVKEEHFTGYNRTVYTQVLEQRKSLMDYFRAVEEQLTNDPYFSRR